MSFGDTVSAPNSSHARYLCANLIASFGAGRFHILNPFHIKVLEKSRPLLSEIGRIYTPAISANVKAMTASDGAFLISQEDT